MSNKFICAYLSCFFTLVIAQESRAQDLYIKGNALFLPVGIVNIGAEKRLSEKYTLEADGMASPWKSFRGKHAQVYMAHLEGRYYFDQAFRHWYIGANAGFGLFDITKWNYIGSGKFQRGFSVMVGAVAGYQWQINENWNIDAFLRGGNSQGFYHGYETESDPPNFIRYDKGSAWNKSGEWIPYGGGVMISYKLK